MVVIYSRLLAFLKINFQYVVLVMFFDDSHNQHH